MPSDHVATHPLRSRARVLLTSVFGPYAQDDEYGSRLINPMELYHNQVTRTQGAYSLRMFHRSFGPMLLQANIDAPCTVLDFPTQDGFIEQIAGGAYDIIGISAITANIGKVERMCALVREHSPRATIVIGGHVANVPDIEQRIDADHVVKGDGVRWFRTFLGADEEQPVRHPVVISGFGGRMLGIPLREKPGDVAGILLPSVGCPVGCNFCSTSAMFGGKGKSINFFETGDELFEVMCQLEEKLQVQSFFVMDENFLLYRKRALRLLELMQEHDKTWSLYVFSSARTLRSYTMEQLVGLGVSWLWLGLEGEKSRYNKLNGIDTKALVREFQSHGIRVLGSTIIGLENHTPENIQSVIDYGVDHRTDFHQFMLYTPIPGTPLWEEHQRDGTLLPESEFGLADIHGQYKFNYRHAHIRDGQETDLLIGAFDRDFEVNGPSLLRLVRTTLAGWQRYRAHPDARVRRRWQREAKKLRTDYTGAIWAMASHSADEPKWRDEARQLLRDLYRQMGWPTRITAPIIGRYLSHTIAREQRRLDAGWTYEPPTICEKNVAAEALEDERRARQPLLSADIAWVTCQPSVVAGR